MWMWTGRLEAMTSGGPRATTGDARHTPDDRAGRLTAEFGDETVSRNLLLKFLATARQSA